MREEAIPVQYSSEIEEEEAHPDQHATQSFYLGHCLSIIRLRPLSSTEGRLSHFLPRRLKPGKNPSKYFATVRNWTRATGRIDSEIHLFMAYNTIGDIKQSVRILTGSSISCCTAWPLRCWFRYSIFSEHSGSLYWCSTRGFCYWSGSNVFFFIAPWQGSCQECASALQVPWPVSRVVQKLAFTES